MGTVYAELGTKVSVVELTDGLLPGADRDLVKPLHQRVEKLFAKILLSTKVASLADKRDSIEVKFQNADGTNDRVEQFERVLVSVGRKPVSKGIGLENTKVKLDGRGFVQTDERQQTADPHILAIGDVAGEPMLAHKASHQGRVAVEALHGGPAAFEPLAIPAVVFTDPEIAWAGLTEDQAKRDNREVEISRYPWAASGRAVSLGRTEGMTKLLVDPETDRILGVGIVGPGAGELIAEGVLAIEMGCTARDVADSIHPHPTLSETTAFASEAYFGTATEIYRPRRDKATGVAARNVVVTLCVPPLGQPAPPSDADHDYLLAPLPASSTRLPAAQARRLRRVVEPGIPFRPGQFTGLTHAGFSPIGSWL